MKGTPRGQTCVPGRSSQALGSPVGGGAPGKTIWMEALASNWSLNAMRFGCVSDRPSGGGAPPAAVGDPTDGTHPASLRGEGDGEKNTGIGLPTHHPPPGGECWLQPKRRQQRGGMHFSGKSFKGTDENIENKKSVRS